MKQLKKISIFCTLLFLHLQGVFAQSAHVQTVMSNYAAFGKGDIPAILNTLAPNCSWYHVGNPAIVPFAGKFSGPEEIGNKFFAVVPTVLEITRFEPLQPVEEGNTVIAKVIIRGKGIVSGKEYESTSEMRWTFNDAGKVVKYENLFDPAGLEAVLAK